MHTQFGGMSSHSESLRGERVCGGGRAACEPHSLVGHLLTCAGERVERRPRLIPPAVAATRNRVTDGAKHGIKPALGVGKPEHTPLPPREFAEAIVHSPREAYV